MKPTNLILIWFAMCLFGIAAPAQNDAAAGSSQSTTPSTTNIAAPDEQKMTFAENLTKYHEDYRCAQWRYSWAYHFCVYVAALLGALAAWLSKVHVKLLGMDDPARRDNWTASMAAGSALLIAISTAGNLADSWQENKRRRYAVESLKTQLAVEQNLTVDELEAYGKRLALIIDPNTELVVPAKSTE